VAADLSALDGLGAVGDLVLVRLVDADAGIGGHVASSENSERGRLPQWETAPLVCKFVFVSGGSLGRLWSCEHRLKPGLPPGAGRTASRVSQLVENSGMGLAKGAVRPGYGSVAQANRPAQGALRPGSGSATGNADGGWRKTQLSQSLPRTRYGGVIPGQLLREGDGEGDERSAATGHAVSYGAGGNRVASSSLRSAVTGDRSMSKLRPSCRWSAATPQW